MSNTNPNWFSWLSFPFFAPLSESVTQDIAPNLLKISDTEKETFQAVSLSDQLEVLREAITELKGPTKAFQKAVEGASPAAPRTGMTIKRVEEMARLMEEIKQRHGEAASLDAERAANRLKEVNPTWRGQRQAWIAR
ncbi:hypothetical protein [Bradyrhizobium sp. CCGUVB23]|uniref:hypothetical protein n=1 Tax=Bradyrhizobium sp. CCGUVB23 TaxID=2949630 RepID=UPI0020B42265|nr:hypothetical protein [Bradyrhizobium sp. CCGUVB23]MCP3468015.1 hypothetical protein [Bradyrhizobium sp. CCGUVB23]